MRRKTEPGLENKGQAFPFAQPPEPIAVEIANFDAARFMDELADPASLMRLDNKKLTALAAEARRRIIAVVSQNGGHLAPSLGVVELTLALLAEFDINRDRLIWDVGHQSYAHKLLTGRAQVFGSLRRLGGISGFPRPEESPYDHFGVGHSSTSISAALGMAMARDLAGLKHHVIAVIGDGSLTAGEAFEGLNLAGHHGNRLIVVLNDNEMSISPNVGALSLFLSRALSSRWIRQTRREALKFLRGIPRIGHKLALYAMRGEWSFKSFFTPGMLFEAFRFNYIGPVDGHDLAVLRQNLRMAAAIEDGPVLLHVRTKKGRGYPPAESNPTRFHGVGNFCPESGELLQKNGPRTFTDVFGETLVQLAETDPRIVAITAAMPEGTGTSLFRSRFPDRFVDTGICEQHAVTFAAGLASSGFRPFLAIYSTFLQRGYDQLVHDVCIQNLPVTFCIDRAGLAGEDGATHQGAFDIAYLRHVPNMHIIAPRNANVLAQALTLAPHFNAPLAIRYPKGACETGTARELAPLPAGRGETLRIGNDLAIIAAGASIYPALQAAETVYEGMGKSATVYDPVWLKPLPEQELESLARQFSVILIVEEGSLAGGFGSAVLEFLNDKSLLHGQKILRLGLGDTFMEHGSQAQLRKLASLDAEGIADAIFEIFGHGRAKDKQRMPFQPGEPGGH